MNGHFQPTSKKCSDNFAAFCRLELVLRWVYLLIAGISFGSRSSILLEDQWISIWGNIFPSFTFGFLCVNFLMDFCSEHCLLIWLFRRTNSMSDLLGKNTRGLRWIFVSLGLYFVWETIYCWEFGVITECPISSTVKLESSKIHHKHWKSKCIHVHLRPSYGTVNQTDRQQETWRKQSQG